MAEKYRQFRLVRREPNREITLNCWLPSAGLKVGFQVTLEAYPDEWWTIEGAGTHEMERDALHTDWKVGGLMGELERMKHKGLKIDK